MKYRDPETGEFKEIYFKAADTLPIGSVIAFGSGEIPTNWLMCDGREVSRETYKDLFSKIGTHYGEGDGETTFNLPNLAGKVAVGYDKDDEDFNTLGETGGEKEHTLTIEEMPSHAHKVRGYYGGANGLNAVSSNNATGGAGGELSYNSIMAEGGNQPHNILQPYVVVNYIIKAFQSAGVVAEVANTESDSTKNTYSCAYINDVVKEVYSTEEQVIGKDENGKNVYKRTFRGNLGDYSLTTFSKEYNNNTIRIKKAFGSLRGSSGAINLGAYVNENFFSGVYVHTEELQVYYGASLKNGTYDITLEFTKTTD